MEKEVISLEVEEEEAEAAQIRAEVEKARQDGDANIIFALAKATNKRRRIDEVTSFIINGKLVWRKSAVHSHYVQNGHAQGR